MVILTALTSVTSSIAMQPVMNLHSGVKTISNVSARTSCAMVNPIAAIFQTKRIAVATKTISSAVEVLRNASQMTGCVTESSIARIKAMNMIRGA